MQQYIAALRKQAAVYRFESITPDEILSRDKIVSGVQDEMLRRNILSRSKLDLKVCITECRMRQQAEKQAATMASGNSQERLAANQDINQACTHAARKRRRRHAVDSTTEDGVQPSGDFATGAVSLITSPTCVGHNKQTNGLRE